ncbi:MAG TPA: PAS domain S-box protein [Spirochaetes bacterium]|nr:PAS domain S-box protein [Spirochaetota bacterium]
MSDTTIRDSAETPLRQGIIGKVLNFFLFRYDNADFVTRQRARVLFAIYVSILLIITPLLTISLSLHTVSLRSMIPPLSAGFLIIVLIALFQRGHLAVSAHSFFIVSLAGIWMAILSANYRGHPVERTDTIVLVLALLTLTPLIVGKRKAAVAGYFVVNGALVLLFINRIHTYMDLPGVIVIEYLIDVGVAFILIGVVSYQIFSINTRALDRAVSEIENNARLNISLSRSEARFRALTENSADLTAIIGPDGHCLYASPSVGKLYGYRPEDLEGNSFLRFLRPDDEAPLRSLIDAARAREGEPLPVECAFRHGNGAWLCMEGTITSLIDSPGVGGLVLALRDVTERKKDRLRTESSLKEKETLLREIHHRVKNNFQIITSLLNLQSRQISDPAFKNVFRDSQNRIRAMALIHEKLYGSGELAFIDIGSYAESLCAELFHLYRPSPANVRVSTVSDKILMDITQAIPCGLILNELVSNALKHAFPAGYEGEGLIEISLRENGGGSTTMTVRDNGVGMKDGDGSGAGTTLGLQLLTLLAEGQLKGTIERTVENGTAYVIQIPPAGGPASQ